MQKITPFLWSDGKAEEAMNLSCPRCCKTRVPLFKESAQGGVTLDNEENTGGGLVWTAGV